MGASELTPRGEPAEYWAPDRGIGVVPICIWVDIAKFRRMLVMEHVIASLKVRSIHIHPAHDIKRPANTDVDADANIEDAPWKEPHIRAVYSHLACCKLRRKGKALVMPTNQWLNSCFSLFI